jgi:hypothetical protein
VKKEARKEIKDEEGKNELRNLVLVVCHVLKKMGLRDGLVGECSFSSARESVLKFRQRSRMWWNAIGYVKQC